MFTFREKHFEIRARISPLARLIHEYLASDDRYHEPGCYPYSAEYLADKLLNVYHREVPVENIESAIEELFFSDLITMKPGLISVLKLSGQSPLLTDIYESVWKKIEKDITQKRINQLIREVGKDEVLRQIEWFHYRNTSWCQSRYNLLVSYCRDRLPEPIDIKRENSEKQKKGVDRQIDDLYDKYRTDKLSKFTISEEKKREVVRKARMRCGRMYTTDESAMMQAVIRFIIDDMAGILGKKEWKKSYEKTKKSK